MTSARAAALRQAIRTAAKAGRADVSDQELLRRFAHAHDQAAFAALVRRHTGLVLGVCRRALPSEPDAEDACQATFLVLARKAGDTRWQPSVANWLYATARKVAHNARVEAERRARREARSAVPEALPPVDRMSARELLAALDDALDRLPPRYREPLVLCFLEGLTRDEGAARLGVPVATLHTRIDRGRKQLHAALTKGGVLLGAGLLTVAVTSPAGAPPPRLFDAIRAAAAGDASPVVAALARGVAVNSVMSQAKWAALAAVLVMVVGLGFTAMSPSAAEPQKPATAKVSQLAPESEERTISGTVVGVDGRPIVAELFANRIEGKPQALGKTNADGTFRVTVALPARGGWLFATAPGHGMDFASPRTDGVTLRLPAEQPIRGRVIDPQGKPLAGLRVTVDGLTAYDGDSFDKHMKRWVDEFYAHGIPPGGDRSMWYRSNEPGHRERESPVHATTDADGKFELTGVGAGQQVGLTVRGLGVALTHISVMNRTGFDPKPYLASANEAAALTPGRQGRFVLLFGPEPQIIVEREKVIHGTVTARDTGKPLAGVPVAAVIRVQLGYPATYEAVTDAAGRYEIHGVRKFSRYFLEARTDPATGYFGSTADVADTAGYEPIAADLQCWRGVIVSGIIKDKATGKPISARIWREEVPGNPLAKDFPASNLKGEVRSDAQGRFRFMSIPGAVLVGALPYKGADRQVYRPAKPDPKYPGVFPSLADMRWCKVIEPKETDRELNLTIELEPATRMAVKVVDADGRPVTGAYATGVTQTDYDRPVHHPGTDALTVYNVDPGQQRLLAVVDVKRRLVGTLTVTAADVNPVV
jgi:RNA polymerase sigma factor (sigma-70 family)